jgi:hypothetical protein
MKTWMRSRISPLSVLKNLRSHAPEIVETINLLPQLLHRAVLQAADDKLQLPVKDLDAERMREEIRASARRRDYAILSAALVLAGMLWFALVRYPPWPGALSLAAGLGIFWGSRR